MPLNGALPYSAPTRSAQWQLALGAELHASGRAGAAPEIFRAAQDGLPLEQC